MTRKQWPLIWPVTLTNTKILWHYGCVVCPNPCSQTQHDHNIVCSFVPKKEQPSSVINPLHCDLNFDLSPSHGIWEPNLPQKWQTFLSGVFENGNWVSFKNHWPWRMKSCLILVAYGGQNFWPNFILCVCFVTKKNLLYFHFLIASTSNVCLIN